MEDSQHTLTKISEPSFHLSSGELNFLLVMLSLFICEDCAIASGITDDMSEQEKFDALLATGCGAEFVSETKECEGVPSGASLH